MQTVSEDLFGQALLDAAQPVPEGLTDGAGRPAGRRYAVYRNNVAVSLREALAVGFPALERLIGAENFGRVAGLYLRQEPPASPLMAGYGAGFPAFLAGLPPLAHMKFLPDVARLELALRRSYHAADSTPIDPAVLQGLDEAALGAARLRLAPSAILLRSAWPVLSIWSHALATDAPKPVARAEDVLVARPGFDPEPHLLPKGGGAFLAAVLNGSRFDAALERAGADFDLPATLTLLLQTGALCAIDVKESPDGTAVRPA
ncbi:DNA-binding domain-containing protein [Thetidibacter halocola]|uniref:Putative DNA-binding domain-containing protein n=1 Tax=Thetidibacter halocola TaxID=2827239 RepID=A0A8J7WIV7_9RHOB|nr:DNA-binding domain-containing protein [Thetidibacter halocola]MBS0126128.1 putative DNA-binding domain-containing protein [Thetidibacter halocola]